MEVFWSMLPERAVQENGFIAGLALAARAGNCGYSYLVSNYGRTDVIRNRLVMAFKEFSKSPDDVLVMLDCDHTHPHDIIERLIRHGTKFGVVGALAFRRGEPYDPCFFIRDASGATGVPVRITGELMQGYMVGTGAIAIRRWVFDKLDEAGNPWPYFVYRYDPPAQLIENGFESEDVYFGKLCEQAGIPHWCDTSIVTPHLTSATIDERPWQMKMKQVQEKEQEKI